MEFHAKHIVMEVFTCSYDWQQDLFQRFAVTEYKNFEDFDEGMI